MAVLVFIVLFGLIILFMVIKEEVERSNSLAQARADKERRKNWLSLEGRFMCASGNFLYFVNSPYDGHTRAKQFVISKFLARLNGVPYGNTRELIDGLCRLNYQSELLGGFGRNIYSPSDVETAHGGILFRVDKSTLVEPFREVLATRNVLSVDSYQPLIKLNPDAVPCSSDSGDWLKLEVSALCDIGSEEPFLQSFRIYVSLYGLEAVDSENIESFFLLNHKYSVLPLGGPQEEAARGAFEISNLTSWSQGIINSANSELLDLQKSYDRAVSSPVHESLRSDLLGRLEVASRRAQDVEVLARESAQNARDLFNSVLVRYSADLPSGHSVTMDMSGFEALIKNAKDCYRKAISLGYSP